MNVLLHQTGMKACIKYQCVLAPHFCTRHSWSLVKIIIKLMYWSLWTVKIRSWWMYIPKLNVWCKKLRSLWSRVILWPTSSLLSNIPQKNSNITLNFQISFKCTVMKEICSYMLVWIMNVPLEKNTVHAYDLLHFVNSWKSVDWGSWSWSLIWSFLPRMFHIIIPQIWYLRSGQTLEIVWLSG